MGNFERGKRGKKKGCTFGWGFLLEYVHVGVDLGDEKTLIEEGAE